MRTLGLVVLTACRAASSPVLEYDGERFPGSYVLATEIELAGADESAIATGTFEVKARADGRFDLFVTEIGLDPKTHDHPMMAREPVCDFALDRSSGPHDARKNEQSFTRYGRSDLSQSLFFLFPPMPPHPFEAGTTWKGTRTLPLDASLPEGEIEFAHAILRLEDCPAPEPGMCAVYGFEGTTGPRTQTTTDGKTVTYDHRYAGEGVISNLGVFIGASVEVEGTADGKAMKGVIAVARE
jgi:hypothetical protein